MSSPPPSNLLLDPLSELTSIIQLNAFGLDLSSDRTHIVLADSFPITPEDRDRIAIESIRSGEIQDGVGAKAVLGLMGGEGEAVVVLDRRGYTLIEAISTTGTKTTPNATYESLEALLIAHSPSYVAAMTAEIERRFASGDFGQIEGDEDVSGEVEADGPAAEVIAEAGEKGDATEALTEAIEEPKFVDGDRKEEGGDTTKTYS